MIELAGIAQGELHLFQDDGGGSIPTCPLQYRIRRIGHITAQRWIEKWHYSHRLPTGENHSFGLFDPSNCLYAVIVFGTGVNPFQAQSLDCKAVIEIKRLARSEPSRDEYPMSKFISTALRLLRRTVVFDACVAFADPDHGHAGTVYKAAGFKHEGMTNAEFHTVDQEGNLRHRRFAFRYARRNKISLQEARSRLNLERKRTAPKHRWVRRYGRL